MYEIVFPEKKIKNIPENVMDLSNTNGNIPLAHPERNVREKYTQLYFV